MIEVEPQATRLNQGTRLARVISESVAQDPMEDVRRRVGPLAPAPGDGIDRDLDLVADRELALVDHDSMTGEPCHERIGVHDRRRAPR